MFSTTYRVYTQTLTLVNRIVVNAFCLPLLEMPPSVSDRLWTQDSPIDHLTSEHNLGPYIVQGRQKTMVICLKMTKPNHDY